VFGQHPQTRKIISDAPGYIDPLAIMRTLWLAASGQPVMKSSFGVEYPEIEVSADTREGARVALDDLIIEAQWDGDLFYILNGLQEQELLSGESSSEYAALSQFNLHVMEVIQDSAIILTMRLLDDFDALVAASKPESA
jgi:hypothetical protein